MEYGESRTESVDILSPKVSIIISCYSVERKEDIYQAVQSVVSQAYPLCEVIVAVDNNPELFEELRKKLPGSVNIVLNTEDKGLSGTRNRGINASKGDIVTFMDDDAVADAHWTQQLVKDYTSRAVLAVGGRTFPLWESSRPCWFPEELDWIVGGTHKGMPEIREQVRNLWGGNMSFRREVFEEIGLFRTDLGRTGASGEGEDTEFCMRLRREMPEAVVLYEPSAIMYHKVPKERATLKYVVRRSLDGGSALAKIRRSQVLGSQPPLSMEMNYLRYLLTNSLPQKIKHIYQPRVMAQMAVLLMMVAARTMGYLFGHMYPGEVKGMDEASGAP